MPMLALILPHVFVGVVLAQPADDRLPRRLVGKWTSLSPNGRTFIDTVDIALDGDGSQGPVKGRVSWRGVNCGASNEPVEGAWDGSTLRLQGMLRPDVNVQRNGGQCGDGKVLFEIRRKGGTAFEGSTSMASTGGAATMKLTAAE